MACASGRAAWHCDSGRPPVRLRPRPGPHPQGVPWAGPCASLERPGTAIPGGRRFNSGRPRPVHSPAVAGRRRAAHERRRGGNPRHASAPCRAAPAGTGEHTVTRKPGSLWPPGNPEDVHPRQRPPRRSDRTSCAERCTRTRDSCQSPGAIRIPPGMQGLAAEILEPRRPRPAGRAERTSTPLRSRSAAAPRSGASERIAAAPMLNLARQPAPGRWCRRAHLAWTVTRLRRLDGRGSQPHNWLPRRISSRSAVWTNWLRTSSSPTRNWKSSWPSPTRNVVATWMARMR